MYFHYINDQTKYPTLTVNANRYLNYYAASNDVKEVKGKAQDITYMIVYKDSACYRTLL